MTCIFLIPVFDDWTAVGRLLSELDGEIRTLAGNARVVLVDDGSPQVPVDELSRLALPAMSGLSVLRLRRNLGHQRAIAIGLCYLHVNVPGEFVIIMDGDGQDRPADVRRLLAAASASSSPAVVFAERTRRSEGPLFFVLYRSYRILHWILTGERVRVGNFSVIPYALLPRLVSVSDLWNHYAAAVFKSRLPYTALPSARGVRYAGRSHMNVVGLVTHGLSAMAAFGDRIGVRLLGVTLLVALVLASGSLAALTLRLAGIIEIPAWAPYGIGLVVLVVFQTLAISLVFVLIILAGRDSSTFLPLRDYGFYILDVLDVQPRRRLDEQLSLRR
jgi:hypothetical protein